MKNLIKLFIAAFFITSVFSLTSCEKEEVTPKKLPDSAAAEGTYDINLNLKKYYLTAKGPQTITYDASYRLQKVDYSPFYYVLYGYHEINNIQYLTAKSFANGIMARKDEYTLNAQGKANELTTSYFANGNLVKTEGRAFVYYANGKLQRIYKKNNAQERTLFYYDANGDLIKLAVYDANGQLEKGYFYSYNDNAGVKKPDLYKFNVELNNLDFYPKIFGIFFKHLPMRLKIVNNNANPQVTDFRYKYEFNTDGMPITRKTYNIPGNNLVASQNYHYLVVNLGSN